MAAGDDSALARQHAGPGRRGRPAIIKALTIHQPWAWAIIHAGKDVENRSRRTSHRGPLAVHAGRTVDAAAIGYLRDRGVGVPDELSTGVVIGVVNLVDCVTGHPSWWSFSGQVQWVLRRPRALALPVPHRGLQMVHGLPADVEDAVTTQMR